MTGHPVFWILVVAVAAPLLAEIPLGFRVPVVVLEVLLGMAIGPHGLDLVRFEGFVAVMFVFGMATTLFMAGMELDWARIRGRPLSLAAKGWIFSLLLGFAIIGILHVVPFVQAPLMVALTLATTSLGVLLPVFRDSGQLETPFGRLLLAAGTLGEVGPIVAMSLLLSQRYSTWQEVGYLISFLGIVVVAAAVGLGMRPPRLLAMLNRTMHASTQLPVRMSLLLVAGLFVLAEEFGFENIFGAFAAGMVVGLVTRGEAGEPLRTKIDAVFFGWFYPFFFVGTGRQVRPARFDARPDDVDPRADVPGPVPAGTRSPRCALSQRSRAAGASALRARIRSRFAVDRCRRHRDRRAHANNAFRHCRGAGGCGIVVGHVVSDNRRNRSFQSAGVAALIPRPLHPGPRVGV